MNATCGVAMSFFDGVTPSVLLEGGSSLAVPHKQPTTWFSSGKQPLKRGGKIDVPPPRRPWTGQSRPQTQQRKGRFGKKNFAFRPYLPARPQTTQVSSQKPPEYRAPTYHNIGKSVSYRGHPHDFHSSPLATMTALKEAIAANGGNKEKNLQSCVDTLRQLATDESNAFHESIAEIMPYLDQALYASVGNSDVRVPLFVMIDRVNEELADYKEREAAHDDKMAMHRKARGELNLQLKQKDMQINALERKLEQEKRAHKQTRMDRRKIKTKLGHSNEQNLSLLSMVTTTDAQRQDGDRKNLEIINRLRQDLQASRENGNAMMSSLVVLQTELEKLRCPEVDQSELGCLKEELKAVKETLTMQRGQYLALRKRDDRGTSIERNKESDQFSYLVGVKRLLPPGLGLSHMWKGKARSRFLLPAELDELLEELWNTYTENFAAALEVWKVESMSAPLHEDEKGSEDNGEPLSLPVTSFKVLDEGSRFNIWVVQFLEAKNIHSEFTWLQNQLRWAKVNNLPPTQMRVLKDSLPQLLIENTKASLVKWQFQSTKFSLFLAILTGYVHEGCYVDQQNMMSQLQANLIKLDPQQTGFVTMSIFMDHVKAFLSEDLSIYEWESIESAANAEAIDGGLLAYGTIFDGFGASRISREIILLHIASSAQYREQLLDSIMMYKGIDNCVDPGELKLAIRSVDPNRPSLSIDNWIGLFLQHSEYLTKKAKSNSKKSKGDVHGSEIDNLRAQAAAFAAAQDKHKRIPFAHVEEALDLFYVRKFQWWVDEKKEW